MPTTGSIKGNTMLLYVDDAGGSTYAAVEIQEDFSLEINGETIDASYKGTNDWGSVLTGSKSYSGTLTAHFTHDASQGVAEFFDNFVADTEFTWEVSSGVTGDIKFSGTAMVGSMSIDWPKNDVSRYTVTFNGIGAITRGVVS